MKRVVIFLCLVLLCQVPAVPAESEKSAASNQEEVQLPNIFIWAIPDEEEQPDDKDKKLKKKEEKQQKDNIETSETTGSTEGIEEEPVVLNAATLKGYAEYVEGADDILYMDSADLFKLNIKTPQKISSADIVGSKSAVSNKKNYYISKFKSEEYAISPWNQNYAETDGNWSFGTSFGSEISTSQLENTTGLFTKYENKYFSLSSNYKKNNPTTTQIQTDNFSITPELKLNNYFSVRDVFSKDITRNRRSSELIFSVNPLGAKDTDRIRLDVGAKQTYDINTGNTWSQLNFTTNFKL